MTGAIAGDGANPFAGISDGEDLSLPAGDRFPASAHLWKQPEIDALVLAWAASRPLLVRGEAGSGKSQIARAAALHLGHAAPLVEVIHPRFEPLDLLYSVDVVARLADAQLGDRLDPSNERYVRPGRLWQALEPETGGDAVPVLLIDEIDKADADVPNALLDVLGNRSFQVPALGDRVVRRGDGRMPLVVVTTNEERELPAAFVRRCVVLNLNPPVAEDDFIDWLIARGKVHRHLRIDEDAAEQAARQVAADRAAAVRAGYPGVGLAEYIDLLTALDDLTGQLQQAARAQEQLYWLERLSAYALVKNSGQDQGRAPVARRDLADAGGGRET